MWSLIVFWTLILVSTASKNLKCTDRPVDLAFVIDSSSSIFPNDFVRQLEFLENITDELDVGTLRNQSRVGVISYSDEPKLEFTLNDYTEKKDVVSAIRRIDYLSGGTNTTAAINLAVDKIFKEENGARKEADDVIVVITDGESFSENETKAAALQARKLGIIIFAIGIGPNVNAKELRLIAGNTDHVYQVSSYADLKSIADILINKTCVEINNTITEKTEQKDTPRIKTGIVERCGGEPADVLFLLDSSSSIHPNDFKKQLRFVKTIISAFDISPGKTAVGVSTFSDEFQFVFHLNDFTTKESIFKAIDNVPYLRGGTDTGNAFWNVRKYGFEVARPNIAHILILITDGLSRDPLETIKQANILKESGVYIFAIGVGPYIDRNELLSMASPSYKDLNFVFNVSTFDALQSIENLLATRTCVIAGQQIRNYSLCTMAKPVDILFAFNAASIGHQNTRLILNTLRKFGNLRFQNEADIHLGIISESCVYGGDIPIQSPNTKLNVSFEKMTSIIKKVKTHGMSTKNGVRSNAVHVVVLVVNEHLEMEDELDIIELETMVDQIYVVYVGDSHSKEIFLSISSPAVKILSMINVNSIAGLYDYFLTELCQNKQK